MVLKAMLSDNFAPIKNCVHVGEQIGTFLCITEMLSQNCSIKSIKYINLTLESMNTLLKSPSSESNQIGQWRTP